MKKHFLRAQSFRTSRLDGQPVQDGSSTTCPFQFDPDALSTAWSYCGNNVNPAVNCCRKVAYVLQDARVEYARTTSALLLPETQARACVEALGRALTAVNVTHATAVLRSCNITSGSLLPNPSEPCGNWDSLPLVSQPISLNGVSVNYTESLFQLSTACLPSTASPQVVSCRACVENTWAEAPGQLPVPNRCQELLGIASAATARRPNGIKGCLFGAPDADTCSMDFNSLDWAPLYELLGPPRRNVSLGCRWVRGQNIWWNAVRAAESGTVPALPTSQAVPCRNALSDAFEAKLGNRTIDGLCRLPFSVRDFNATERPCKNNSLIEDYRVASNNFRSLRVNCLESCSAQSCYKAFAGIGVEFGTADDPAQKCTEDLSVAFAASLIQTNITAALAFINCLGIEANGIPRQYSYRLPPPVVTTPVTRNTTEATESSSSSGGRSAAIIGGVTGGAAFLLLVVSLTLLWVKRARRKQAEQDANTPFVAKYSSSASFKSGGPFLFTYQQLRTATNDFSEKNAIGQGGSGKVYLGVVPTGEKVAVKVLFEGAAKHKEQEFRNEAAVIGTISHKNLVQLRGCCLAGTHRLLVYDYMPNGSVEDLLFKPPKGVLLDWDTRFKVALGAARGLVYLHEESTNKVIHRDVKPSNILLDENFNARMADFGLAKLAASDETHVSTGVVGTWGYLAPEYVASGQVSDKSDVFSYGVVLLVLVSGRQPMAADAPEAQVYLAEWAWLKAEHGDVLDIIDPKISIEGKEEVARRVIQVAVRCVHTIPRSRPSMREVLRMLQGEQEIPPLPTRPISMFHGLSYSWSNSTLDSPFSSSKVSEFSQHSADMRFIQSLAPQSAASSGDTLSSVQDPRKDPSEEMRDLERSSFGGSSSAGIEVGRDLEKGTSK